LREGQDHFSGCLNNIDNCYETLKTVTYSQRFACSQIDYPRPSTYEPHRQVLECLIDGNRFLLQKLLQKRGFKTFRPEVHLELLSAMSQLREHRQTEYVKTTEEQRQQDRCWLLKLLRPQKKFQVAWVHFVSRSFKYPGEASILRHFLSDCLEYHPTDAPPSAEETTYINNCIEIFTELEKDSSGGINIF
jgi:hypothetical protein